MDMRVGISPSLQNKGCNLDNHLVYYGSNSIRKEVCDDAGKRPEYVKQYDWNKYTNFQMRLVLENKLEFDLPTKTNHAIYRRRCSDANEKQTSFLILLLPKYYHVTP